MGGSNCQLKNLRRNGGRQRTYQVVDAQLRQRRFQRVVIFARACPAPLYFGSGALLSAKDSLLKCSGKDGAEKSGGALTDRRHGIATAARVLLSAAGRGRIERKRQTSYLCMD